MNRVMVAWTVALALGGISLTGCGRSLSKSPAREPHVLTANPVRKTISRKLGLPGDVLPFQEVILYARVQGYLDSMDVDRGDFVKKGQVLAKISVPDLEKKLAEKEADLALCPPAIARDQAVFEWRQREWERLKNDTGKTPEFVSQNKLDNARGRYESAKAELDVTKAREMSLRADIEKARTMVEFAVIKAPFDGYVTDRWVDPGDLIRPASTMMLQVTQIDPVRVRIRVPEPDVQLVNTDTKVTVSFTEFPDKKFKTTVTRVFWALDQKTKAMRAEIDVINPNGAIRPGMFANVMIDLETHKNALVLPASALVAIPEKVNSPKRNPNILRLPGDVLPFQQVVVYARVKGYLGSIAVDHGDFVKKGDVLAYIAVPELERQLAKEEAELALSPPAIARDQAVFQWRQREWTRIRKIAEKTPNLINGNELDNARGRYETAKAELELTRAKEATLHAVLEKTRTMIDFATIKAPFDGCVVERWVDPGDLIDPGKTGMLRLLQVDPLRIRVHIPQADVPFIKSGIKARVEFPFADIPGEPFEYPVKRFFWALNRNTKTMSAEIDLPNRNRSVRPGMYADVTIDLDKPPPPEREDEKKKKRRMIERTAYYVYLVDGGTVRKTPIQLGYDDGIEFEVLSGVNVQDEVIVIGKNLASDGEKVRTTKQQ